MTWRLLATGKILLRFNQNLADSISSNVIAARCTRVKAVLQTCKLTECPKIYRKSVLRYRFAVFLQKMQYRFALNFGTLSIWSQQFSVVFQKLSSSLMIFLLCTQSVTHSVIHTHRKLFLWSYSIQNNWSRTDLFNKTCFRGDF